MCSKIHFHKNFSIHHSLPSSRCGNKYVCAGVLQTACFCFYGSFCLTIAAQRGHQGMGGAAVLICKTASRGMPSWAILRAQGCDIWENINLP